MQLCWTVYLLLSFNKRKGIIHIKLMRRRHYPIEPNCVFLVVVAASSIDLSPLPISNDIEQVN